MAIKPIPKDYKPPEGGELKQFDKGHYKVKGIEWFGLDDDGRPILIKQKNGRKGRLKFVLMDGESGPPYFLELHQMALLVGAFNVDVSKLPKVPALNEAGKISDYMIQVADLINQSGNETTVEVGDAGFVDFVEGMTIEGNKNYYLRIVDIVSKDDKSGQYSWRRQSWPKGGHSDFIDLILEIVAGVGGKDTPYRGARFKVNLDYGFEYDEEKKELSWHTTDSGKWSARASIASKVYQTLAPTMFDDWAPDNERNVVPYWVKHMGLPSPVFMGFVEFKESESGYKYYKVSWGQIERIDDFKIEESEESENIAPTGRMVKTDNEMNNKALAFLSDAFKFINSGEPVLDNEFELTESGRQFAVTYLTPLKEQGKIKPMKFKDMEQSDCYQMLNALAESLEKDSEARKSVLAYAEKISLLLIGMEDSIQITPAIEEMPF